MRQIKYENRRSKLAARSSPLGFTLLETLVAVAMLSALTLLVTPLVGDSLTRGDNQRFAAEAVDSLREAQANVMSGKNGARYGVHFEATKFTLFQGATYSVADGNNVTHVLTGDTSITAVSLSPGGSCTVSTGSGNCDVHFSSRKGVPTESGTITLTSPDSVVRTVTVNAAGMTEWK